MAADGRATAALLLFSALSACMPSEEQLRARAAYELNCPEKQLVLTDLERGTHAVQGCGQRAIYIMRCDTTAVATTGAKGEVTGMTTMPTNCRWSRDDAGPAPAEAARVVEPKPAPPPERKITPVAAPGLKGFVMVAAGRYRIGSDDQPEERPIHKVDIAEFALQTLEASVLDYSACVTAGACTKAGEAEGCNAAAGDDKVDHPINCISARQAADYCRFRGGRLPKEEEWEAAVRGPTGTSFAWGNGPPDQKLCWHKRGTCTGGIFPNGASSFGLLDLHGNVSEWTQSSFCTYPNHACEIDKKRVARGGSYASTLKEMRAAARQVLDPEKGYVGVGVRCAADVAPIPPSGVH